MTIVGPVAIPQRNASADYAGEWLLAGFASLSSRVCFVLPNERSVVDGRIKQTKKVETGSLVWSSQVLLARCPFHCYT